MNEAPPSHVRSPISLFIRLVVRKFTAPHHHHQHYHSSYSYYYHCHRFHFNSVATNYKISLHTAAKLQQGPPAAAAAAAAAKCNQC